MSGVQKKYYIFGYDSLGVKQSINVLVDIEHNYYHSRRESSHSTLLSDVTNIQNDVNKPGPSILVHLHQVEYVILKFHNPNLIQDECTMSHKHVVEALNRSLQDIRSNETLMDRWYTGR
ncbi:unnamed protein product [Diatraea saccharalis]|uniref:Uncharacterized protein n=1 Tax=Diatraea saccharalis TaxID=40085 RepID=A0A9N9QY86_9NEOP|nr:unnamed protein product [Diatraea saccharalis]